jgi:hypothetical protein
MTSPEVIAELAPVAGEDELVAVEPDLEDAEALPQESEDGDQDENGILPGQVDTII